MERLKIAALIQAHHRPDLLGKLIDRLSPPLWDPYLHLDAKADAREFEGVVTRAIWLRNRVAVRWAGFSQVDATLRLIGAALRDPDVTHLYHMSGQCFPVKSDPEIAGYISGLRPGSANLIEMVKMPVSHKPITRYTERGLHDLGPGIRRKFLERLFSRYPEQSLAGLRGVELYGGGSWWLLERSAAERILAFTRANPWFLRCFRYSLSPDEMVFQTLVAHLGLVVGGPMPTASKWVGDAPNPEPITPSLHAEFAAGPALFARKYVDFHPA